MDTSEYNRTYYQQNKERIAIKRKAHAMVHGGWPNPKTWAQFTPEQRTKYLKQRRNVRAERKLKLVEMMGGKCVRCGYNEHPAALEFDHIDPSQKSFGIATSMLKSWPRLLEEISKCRLLCSNCHAIRTHDPASY